MRLLGSTRASDYSLSLLIFWKPKDTISIQSIHSLSSRPCWEQQTTYFCLLPKLLSTVWAKLYYKQRRLSFFLLSALSFPNHQPTNKAESTTNKTTQKTQNGRRAGFLQKNRRNREVGQSARPSSRRSPSVRLRPSQFFLRDRQTSARDENEYRYEVSECEHNGSWRRFHQSDWRVNKVKKVSGSVRLRERAC